MRKLLAATWVILNITIIAQSQAKADEAPAHPQTEAKPALAPAYSTEALDLTTTKLPAGYMGHDPERLYTALAGKFSEKGEFESTQEYEARLAQARTTPVIANLSLSDTFAGQIDLSKGTHEVRYDADQKVLRVTLELDLAVLDTGSFRYENRLKEIRLKERTKVLDVYTGKTAAGVEREVPKRQMDSWELLFTNFQSFPFKRGKYADVTFDMELPIALPMDVPAAKAAKPNLRALAVFQFKEPYIRNYENHVMPTLSLPEERLLHWYFLVTEVKEIWFYNLEMGEVYSKIRSAK